MPVQVIKEIKATHLRQDDRVILSDVPPVIRTVASVSRGTKWMTATFHDTHKPLKVLLSDPVLVERTEPTPEEIEAKQRLFANESLVRYIQSADGAVEEARSKLVENLEFRPDVHAHYYETLIAAQTEAGLWASVLAASLREDVLDLHDAAVLLRADVVEALVEERRGSRSTNQMTNAVNNVVQDAKAAWARNLKWTLI